MYQQLSYRIEEFHSLEMQVENIQGQNWGQQFVINILLLNFPSPN